MDERIYAHSLKLILGVGILRIEKLYKAFGSFEKIWRASYSDIVQKTKDGKLAESLKQREKINPEEEFEKLKKQGIGLMTIEDPSYPPLLKEIAHPPLSIYYKGEIKDFFQKFKHCVTIVGTRKATAYGREKSRELARDLSSEGIVVVSGLAFGVDGEAHKGALEGGAPTIAVLGSGLNSIYPAYHKDLARKIVEKNGLIFSEYHPEQKAAKWTFPERNRIAAGLSLATIVIEAPQQSGSLITANFALDANREVGAMPGDVSSFNSEGTNNLIKSGAALIRHSDDILELIGLKRKKKNDLDNLSEIEKYVINLLDSPKTREELSVKDNFSLTELNQAISILEIRGLIENKGGMFYRTRKV